MNCSSSDLGRFSEVASGPVEEEKIDLLDLEEFGSSFGFLEGIYRFNGEHFGGNENVFTFVFSFSENSL